MSTQHRLQDSISHAHIANCAEVRRERSNEKKPWVSVREVKDSSKKNSPEHIPPYQHRFPTDRKGTLRVQYIAVTCDSHDGWCGTNLSNADHLRSTDFSPRLHAATSCLCTLITHSHDSEVITTCVDAKWYEMMLVI